MAGTIVHFGLPLLVTMLFMFALRPIARGIGLIDRPGGRKMHVGEVPVIGGLAMSVMVLVHRHWAATPIEFDTTLQRPLMVAFFTSIGFGASYRLLRVGGPQVLWFLLAC